MLIPTSFGQFTGTFTAPDGSVQTFTQPPTYKGASSRRQPRRPSAHSTSRTPALTELSSATGQ